MRIKVALYIVYISNLLVLNIREFKLFYLQKGNEKIQWIKVIKVSFEECTVPQKCPPDDTQK